MKGAQNNENHYLVPFSRDTKKIQKSALKKTMGDSAVAMSSGDESDSESDNDISLKAKAKIPKKFAEINANHKMETHAEKLFDMIRHWERNYTDISELIEWEKKMIRLMLDFDVGKQLVLKVRVRVRVINLK